VNVLYCYSQICQLAATAAVEFAMMSGSISLNPRLIQLHAAGIARVVPNVERKNSHVHGTILRGSAGRFRRDESEAAFRIEPPFEGIPR
jgi:hypothetical protein